MRHLVPQQRCPSLVRASDLSIPPLHATTSPTRIWIDLDNSPHVPFFVPIIEELKKRGYSVLLTARDCYQVSELIKLHGLNCIVIGRHYGKHKLLKVIGTFIRAARLSWFVICQRPHFAISHGSRAQIAVCTVLRVPSLMMDDYEHSCLFVTPDWLMIPELLRGTEARIDKQCILTYPGTKEDVYIPRFTPDPTLRATLGFSDSDLLVTVRPPADEAHYHNRESDSLYRALVEYLLDHPGVKIVLLPRTQKQAAHAREAWPDALSTRTMVIPDRVVDGLSLIWWSDLVVSGGGTMNREAAALRVPVYSIFRGQIGAVDRYLAMTGRLTMLESTEDIVLKVALERRPMIATALQSNGPTLEAIVDNLVGAIEAY